MVSCGGFGFRFRFAFLLCLVLGVCRCPRYHIREKFELVKASDCICCSNLVVCNIILSLFDIPTSAYWTFLRGLFSALIISCVFSTRCWMNISVAIVMTKAALLEQFWISSSACTIFLTRATERVSYGSITITRNGFVDVILKHI